MNKKPVSPSQIRSFALSLAVGGALVIAAGQAYLRLSPVTYRTSVRIKLNKWTAGRADQKEPEERLVSSECRELSSDTNLDEVLRQLVLKEPGKSLLASHEPARNPLRTKVSVQPLPHSLSFTVAATDANPRLAADIVKTLVDQYTARRSNDIAQSVQSMVSGYNRGFNQTDEKISLAKKRMDELYIQAASERLKDTNQYYDQDTYQLLLKKRGEIAGELSERQAELDHMKTLAPPDLRMTLATNENNRQLTNLLAGLAKADAALRQSKNDYGPESPHVKSAEAMRNQLDEQVDRQTAALLQAAQTRVETLAAALETFNVKLRNATTNPPAPTPVEQDYAAAKKEWESLQEDHSGFTKLLGDRISQTPLETFKFNYSPQVLDPMDASANPFSPDPNLARRSALIGIFSIAAAAFLTLVSKRAKPASSPRNNPPTPTKIS